MSIYHSFYNANNGDFLFETNTYNGTYGENAGSGTIITSGFKKSLIKIEENNNFYIDCNHISNGNLGKYHFLPALYFTKETCTDTYILQVMHKYKTNSILLTCDMWLDY